MGLSAQRLYIVWHYTLRTASIAQKWCKVKSSDPDNLYLTLYAMLKKAMDGFGRVVGSPRTFRMVNW